MDSRGPEEHADSHRRRRASSGRKPQHTSSAAPRLKTAYRDSLREDYEPGSTSAIDTDSETSDYHHTDGGPSTWHDHSYLPRQSSPGRKRTSSSASRSKMDPLSSQAYPTTRTSPWPSHRSNSGVPPPGSGLGPEPSSWSRPKQSSSPPNVEPESSHHRRKSSSAKSSKVPSTEKASTRRRPHRSSREDPEFHQDTHESAKTDSGNVDAEENPEANKAFAKVKTYDGLPVLDVEPEVCDAESDSEAVDDDKQSPRLLTAGEEKDDEDKTSDKKVPTPKAPATSQATKDSPTTKAKASSTESTAFNEDEERDGSSSDSASEYTDSDRQSDDECDNSDKQLISINPEKQQIAEISPIKDINAAKDAQDNKDTKDSKRSKTSTASKESTHRSRHRKHRKSSHHDHEFLNRKDLPRAPTPPAKTAPVINSELSDSESGACSSKHYTHGRRSSMRSSGRSSRHPTSENYTTKPHVPESMQSRSGTMPMPMPTSQRNRRSRRSNGEWTEHETGGSIGSDHRGSFSHANRPPVDPFPRRPDGYEYGWNPQTGSGNSNMSQSPDYSYAGISESNDESHGRHSSSHARSNRHRNSTSQHSSTPPVSQSRRRDSFHDRASRESTSRPANISLPEAPEAPTDSSSNGRPHHPGRTVSGSSTRVSEPVMPPVPPSPNSATSDKRRRPSYTSVRPAMGPQRPSSAIPEESGDEMSTASCTRADSCIRAPTPPPSSSRRDSSHEEAATRPTGRRSSKHNPPTVPFVRGTTKSSPEEEDDDDEDIPPMAAARTEICDEFDDETGYESSVDGFRGDNERLEDRHPFMKCSKSALQNALRLHAHWVRTGGALRSPPITRYDADGPTVRRPRGNSRANDKPSGFEPSGFSGSMGSSHTTRRRSSMSFQPMVFACPFPVNDKQEFSGCGGFVFSDIESLVIHIRWCHRFTIHCPRCMKTYQTYRERDAHLKAEPPCLTRNLKEHNGVVPEKRQQIYKIAKSSRSRPLEQWKEIYNVIFPDTEAPNNTVISDDLIQQLNSFRDWNDQAGEQSVVDVLKAQNLFYTVADEDLAIGVKSFTHMVYEAACHSIYNDWFDRTMGPEPYSNPGLDSPCTVSSDATGSSAFSPRTPTSGSWNTSVPYSPAVNATRRMFPGNDPMNTRSMPRRQSITRGATIPPNPAMGAGMPMPPSMSMPMPVPMSMPMNMNAQPPMMGVPGAAFGHSYTSSHGDEYMKMAGMAGGSYYDPVQFDGMVGSVPQVSSVPMVTPMNERYMGSGYFSGGPQKRPSY